jgi:bifunctional non-homologous end joining protein LigD
MGLNEYNKKRDFKKSPEPATGETKPKASLSFVVQRHDARRLHYDFRLEMEGVLKSWAVPKGPSMIAGDKRLAVMVEDHPYSYGEFYGVIPKGNYGAGTVEIWDKGVYMSKEGGKDGEKKLLKALEEGNLKFVVLGTHLKGEFALIRLKDSTTNEWLLIKKNDEYALKHFDIEKIKPLKTIPKDTTEPNSTDGESNNNKKPSKKAEKNLKINTNTSKKSGNEKSFFQDVPKPMLARLSTQIIDKPDWLYEIKYDGYRIIAQINNGAVKLISRNGNDYTKKFNAISSALSNISQSVILDGEVVIENSKGISDFQRLQNYQTTQDGILKYYVFDLLYLNGQSTTNIPLSGRKELLEVLFTKYSLKNIFNSDYQTGGGKKLFEKLASQGYEGVIAKSPQSKYLPGKRADTWLKIKANTMQEAVICGYTLPQSGRKYFGSLILGLYEQNKLIYIGNCGTGFNDVSLKELFNRFEKIKSTTSPFETIPKFSYTKGKPVWVNPLLVCNVKFSEWTQSGNMRNPVFMGLREDKDAIEVVKEKNNETQHDEPPKKWPVKKTYKISGNQVHCTNLNKIYWPDEGYVKGEVIEYYLNVSEYMIPHLKNRPQSLNRHPNGINGPSFYHKNMEVKQLPGWVQTTKVFSRSNSNEIDYLICNDAATLVYMANLGCIEINPWHSVYTNPENPDYMMLDLDPGDISFKEVVKTALVIKEITDELQIPSYCKTSGAKGLHIFIPLQAQYNYEQVKTFAELLAHMTHHRIPQTTSIERSKAKRKDKVYIDFLQNRKGQTIAAPYSIRPRPGATVSTPLFWDEVNEQLTPQMFTIKNMMQRLQSIGDIWAPVLENGIKLKNVLNKIQEIN